VHIQVMPAVLLNECEKFVHCQWSTLCPTIRHGISLRYPFCHPQVIAASALIITEARQLGVCGALPAVKWKVQRLGYPPVTVIAIVVASPRR
jgi:hypothetical protein